MAFLSPDPVTMYLSSAEISQLSTDDDSLDWKKQKRTKQLLLAIVEANYLVYDTFLKTSTILCNMIETLKISYNLHFSHVFNEIALHPIDSPLPLFNVEYVKLSDRFCGQNNIEMGRRGKRKHRCPRQYDNMHQMRKIYTNGTSVAAKNYFLKTAFSS